MLYCNQQIETMPRETMRQLQTDKLRKMIKWTYEKSAFYKEQMTNAGLTDASICTLEDLAKLPFTTKAQLYTFSPFDFLTGPISSTLRLETVGKDFAVTRAFTAGDVGRNVDMMARCLIAGGIHRASVLQIFGGYACGDSLTMQYAGEALGVTIAPVYVQKPELCMKQIGALGVSALATNIQGLLCLMAAERVVNDESKGKLSSIFLFNPEIKNHMKNHIAERFGAQVFNLYVPPELACPGIFFDCVSKEGMHVQEDYFYPEVIDPFSGETVEDGRVGELVITALEAEAMPLIRYRTGKMVSLEKDVCKCGRTLPRVKAL